MLPFSQWILVWISRHQIMVKLIIEFDLKNVYRKRLNIVITFHPTYIPLVTFLPILLAYLSANILIQMYTIVIASLHISEQKRTRCNDSSSIPSQITNIDGKSGDY